MKITVLLENSRVNPELSCAHGLSLLAEWDDNCVLIDTGPERHFIDNAVFLGKELSKVQSLIISHGHRDHGGGLEHFLQLNGEARVYLHKDAFENHWAIKPDGGLKSVSLDDSLPEKYPGRVEYVDKFRVLGDILIFACDSNVGKSPVMNENLLKGQTPEKDDFGHEINVLINDGTGKVLFVGCAHRGIINILHSCREITGTYPELVVGGFHLSSKGLGKAESEASVRQLAHELKAAGCTYITGHCTGETAAVVLKEVLGEKLFLMSSGISFCFDEAGDIYENK